MNLLSSSSRSRRSLVATALITTLLTVSSIAARAATTPALLDDFSDAKRNSNGIDRLLIDDKGAGSQSHASLKCENGIIAVEGELVPGRGVPAFISVVSLLSPEGKPHDLTGYEGVRLRVKPGKGPLAIQVSSTEIQNFDYHTSAPIAVKRGEFTEVRISFKDMKRAWSEQTALNLKSITSINLVSFSMAKADFSYAVDEIGFY